LAKVSVNQMLPSRATVMPETWAKGLGTGYSVTVTAPAVVIRPTPVFSRRRQHRQDRHRQDRHQAAVPHTRPLGPLDGGSLGISEKLCRTCRFRPWAFVDMVRGRQGAGSYERRFR
jgi:hypothetical protein